MTSRIIGLVFALTPWMVSAQTMTLSTSSSQYQITNTFSDVDFFSIAIEIDAPLAAGVYIDPPIVSVTYQVTGSLVPGTPSGFPAFDLQRTISGTDFYDQGSSLQFEIAPAAVLSDGIQVAELVGSATVFTFNGREIDNGRFHPALLELNANGTGRIQNSDNVPSLNPLQEVAFGEEYITDLVFDAGNTTIITGLTVTPPAPAPSGGGGGALSLLGLVALLFAAVNRERGVLRLFRSRVAGKRWHQ